MSKPYANIPSRVALIRIGESPSFGEQRALDCAEELDAFWHSTIARQPDFEADREHLVVVLLTAKLRLIGYHVVASGTLSECCAHPREIFRAAIISASYAIVVMHNHPSGDAAPSSADRRLTSKLREAASIIDISLLDHVIVGQMGTHYSFREAGLL